VFRAADQVGEYILHMNPVALGRWTMAILRKYGPGAAGGFIVMEVTEQWAGYYAMTGSVTWLRALAGAFSITHAGDIVFTLALFGTPHLINHLSWARYNFGYYSGNPLAYRDQLRRLRRALPIDWTLDPYVDGQGEFLVLDKGRWSNPRTWSKRILPNLRHILQAESFATVSLDDLERVARRRGVTVPPTTMGFHAQTELLVAGLRSTLEGTLDLDSLVSAAQNRVRATAADGDELSEAVVAAERLRVALDAQVTELLKLDGRLRHRRAHDILAQSVKALRRLGHELENPALTAEGLQTRAAEAARVIAGFEEQTGLYRGDVTSSELASRFNFDLSVAKQSLEFFVYLRLAQAQQEARLELASASFNPLLRLRLLERIAEAETFWQLAEAVHLVADAWPEDYLSMLNDVPSGDHAHEHGDHHDHGHHHCAADLTPQ
jgi:hypothetical protein